MASGMRLHTERIGNGVGQPLLDAGNGEELMHVQAAVFIVLADSPADGPGTLYITSKKVIWLSDLDASKGYAVDFVSISLHAVSRDPESYPSPCIYTQIDNGEDDAEDEDEEAPESHLWASRISKVKEMRLVPSDPSQLEILFEVFCQCAELNPESMQHEEEEEHNWIFSADQLTAQDIDEDDFETCAIPIGHSNGDHDLVHNVLQLQINDERFEDAEEMEHGQNGN